MNTKTHIPSTKNSLFKLKDLKTSIISHRECLHLSEIVYNNINLDADSSVFSAKTLAFLDAWNM